MSVLFPATTSNAVDVVIVGAGFAGLYMLHRVRELGLSTQLYEAAGGVGGTWLWNRYPGARCDVESMAYSYSFSTELEQEWSWTERYPSQTEIIRYLNHVADRFTLWDDIQLNTRVVAASFDDATGRWQVSTDHGDRMSSKYCVMATGCLSEAQVPDLPGLGDFTGNILQTGRWPAGPVDFSGQRVGVIGTGSSGVQVIPAIAEVADEVVVFQRTANFSVPARNRPLDPESERDMKATYPHYRHAARTSAFGIPYATSGQSALEVTAEQRERTYEEHWQRGGVAIMASYADLITNLQANDTVADFVRDKIRETVRDPGVAEMLVPRNYPFAAKRVCVDTDYFTTFNREHVTLVNVGTTPIETVTRTGVHTRSGSHRLDGIVFATGFDAMTGALRRIDIRGTGGQELARKWADGPRTYLGLAVAGFPNLFLVTGPGSPSVLSNMPVSIEQHVEWIAEAMAHLEQHGIGRMEPTREAEDSWTAHVNEMAASTLFPLANSWYLGANIPGKPRVFMPYVGGVGAYREKCAAVAESGYPGFSLVV
jgi:cyclohexanone monooxygenase